MHFYQWCFPKFVINFFFIGTGHKGLQCNALSSDEGTVPSPLARRVGSRPPARALLRAARVARRLRGAPELPRRRGEQRAPLQRQRQGCARRGFRAWEGRPKSVSFRPFASL